MNNNKLDIGDHIILIITSMIGIACSILGIIKNSADAFILVVWSYIGASHSYLLIREIHMLCKQIKQRKEAEDNE